MLISFGTYFAQNSASKIYQCLVGTLVMAPRHLVSVLFGDLLSHSYNITFSVSCIKLIFSDIDRKEAINSNVSSDIPRNGLSHCTEVRPS